ncbi:MAG: helix-turn-helix domain-containing protein, partial [Trinickia sp.]
MDSPTCTPISAFPSRCAVSATDDQFASTIATSFAGVVSFLAVAREGSFARAGDRLGIGRSSV